MDEIIKKASELKEAIEEEPLIKEYKRVKALYDNDETIKELKKEIVRAKNENRLEDQKALLEKLNGYPLEINYQQIKDEVGEYLLEISNIINKK